jgi:two-component system chemotaxis response regulator CheY
VNKTVLAVDDSASVRQVVRFTLAEGGYQVVEAVDGKDALLKLSQHPVHLIVTDLNMPNMDGITLLRSVRANAAYKGLPVILLTTESAVQKKEEGKASGATGWIVKPFTPPQLLAVVKKVIG